MDAGYGNQEPTTETQPLTVGDTKTQGSLLCEPPNGNAPAMPDAQLAGVASPNSSTSRTRPADPPRQASRSFERVLVAWQEFGFGPICDIISRSAEVCSRMQTGPHLVTLSSSQFDPLRK